MRRSSLVGAQVTEEDRLRCPICVLDRLRHFNAAVGWHRAMLPGYLDTNTDTRYVDTPIRHFSKNTDTGIREYIYKIFQTSSKRPYFIV